MNSSGIKRGLATTAVSALALTGIPFIASSASAAPGDSIAVSSVGPIRNAGTEGGLVVLKTKGIDEDDLKLKATNLTSGPNSPTQTVSIVDATLVASGAQGDSAPNDGLDEITVELAVTTPNPGDTFSVAIYEDERDTDDDNDPTTPLVGNDTVDAAEARATISGSTTGAPASIVISPDSQTTSANVPTGNYTATIRDASNNLTQLTGGENFDLAGNGVTFNNDPLDANDLQDGSATFTATSGTPGATTFTATGAGGVPATVNDSAVINVIENATITADEFDLVTDADEFEAGDSFGGTYEVRVDQGAITFNFQSLDKVAPAGADDANKAVVLTLTGNGVTFGGQTTRAYTVVLDANGAGTLTVNPEGVTAGDSFTFASAGSSIPSTTVEFTRAEADSVEAGQDVYVTQVGGTTAVTVAVVDQFGDPIGAPAQVSINRGARNGSTETARQTVGADGTATFNLPDAGTTVGSETFTINLYEDQFDGTANTENGGVAYTGGRIDYTADGLGRDFTLNDITPGSIVPLTDGVASDVTESKVLTITGGTPNAPATVTVDNGARILGANDNLSSATGSKTITLDGNGDGSVEIVGTATGTVTATVTSSGRSKTETLTVAQNPLTVVATARNIELEGPENVVAGDVATYTATVTDAFGNPVAGYDDSDVIFQISGPGSLQNKEAATDATGEIEQTVLLTDNADGSITVSVRGEDAQFGARASEEEAGDGLNTAPGLTASQDTDSVTSDITNIEDLEQAVEEAERDLAESQANLAVAQANLDVAQAQLDIATAEVDRLQERKQNLRQKLNRAKANDNKQKAKTTRKKIRRVKTQLRDARQAVVIAQAAVDGATTVRNLRQDEVTAAEEALAQAQADLDEAQN